MIRIGRDHGKFKHEVGMLPMSELVDYEANYIYEYEIQKKADEKAGVK